MMIYKNFLPKTFNWASYTDESKNFVVGEIFLTNIYGKYVCVKPNDIVVDIGSSLGPFSYLALMNQAGRVYCVEPSELFIKSSIQNLSEFIINKKKSPVVFINHAISGKTDLEKKYLENLIDHDGNRVVSTITFSDLIKAYDLHHINFLKIDCEGGEYDIFTKENINYLVHCVDFIACEFHGRFIQDGIEKHRYFKHNILPHFPYYRVCCGVSGKFYDLTEYYCQNDFQSDFLLKVSEVMFYLSKNPLIDNTVPPFPMDQITYVNG